MPKSEETLEAELLDAKDAYRESRDAKAKEKLRKAKEALVEARQARRSAGVSIGGDAVQTDGNEG